MTHEEAVKNLDTMWKMLTKAYDEIPDSFVVAFTKAIDALKTETEEDTISRQAAITEFSCCELTPDGGIDANYAIEFLKQLPPAQPEYKLDEWCEDCKEYDHKRHCCPRWNRVIRETLDDVRRQSNE